MMMGGRGVATPSREGGESWVAVQPQAGMLQYTHPCLKLFPDSLSALPSVSWQSSADSPNASEQLPSTLRVA